MRFAHLADVHIGSWRDPRMKPKSLEAFTKAVDICIDERVDFALICGDLFNTAIPPMDLLRGTIEQLQRLKEHDIPVYLIAGSHDYSPTGKTMLDILETTGLIINVMRGERSDDGKLQLRLSQDAKTGTLLTGILGKAGQLEQGYYELLDRDSLIDTLADRPSIFMFHSAITEALPRRFPHMHSTPASLLPKGFGYYAGGHVHVRSEQQVDGYGTFVYPGPIFPASFSEIESLGGGSMVIVEDGDVRFHHIDLHPTTSITVDVSNKTMSAIRNVIHDRLAGADIEDAIITLRLKGRLHEGTIQDLDIASTIQDLYHRGAFFVMKNTLGVQVDAYESISVDLQETADIERSFIKEQADNVRLDISDMEPERLISSLMDALACQKQEGETNSDYQSRILDAALTQLPIEDIQDSSE